MAGWSQATWGAPVNAHAGFIDAFAAKIGSAGITSVTSASADGIYGIGAGIDVTVNFTEPATLSGGNLTVNLDTGGAATISPFGPAASASGTYTVTIGESSPDLDSSSPLVLAGGATLRDAGNSDVTLTIPAGQSLADGKAIVVIGPLVLGEIPTLSEWGMALFVGLILMASFGLIKRRNARGA